MARDGPCGDRRVKGARDHPAAGTAAVLALAQHGHVQKVRHLVPHGGDLGNGEVVQQRAGGVVAAPDRVLRGRARLRHPGRDELLHRVTPPGVAGLWIGERLALPALLRRQVQLRVPGLPQSAARLHAAGGLADLIGKALLALPPVHAVAQRPLVPA